MYSNFLIAVTMLSNNIFQIVTAIVSLISFVFIPISAFFAFKYKLQIIEKRIELLEIKEIKALQCSLEEHVKNEVLSQKAQSEILNNLSKKLDKLILEFEIRVIEPNKNY